MLFFVFPNGRQSHTVFGFHYRQCFIWVFLKVIVLVNTLILHNSVKIEQDATLNTLVHRYIESESLKLKGNDPQKDTIVTLLHLNPQVYRLFPQSHRDWKNPYVLKKKGSDDCIRCADSSTTIRPWISEDIEQNPGEMFLILDQNNQYKQRAIMNGLSHKLPNGETTWRPLNHIISGHPAVALRTRT